MKTIFTHKYTSSSKDILDKTKCFLYPDYFNNPKTDYIGFCFNKDGKFEKGDIKQIDEYGVLQIIGKTCLYDLINNNTLKLNISELNNLTLAFFMQYYYFSNSNFKDFTKQNFSFVILDDLNKYNLNKKFKLYLEDNF